MPTFPSHWAGISGSIEEDDSSPLEAAVRELQEETNLEDLFAKYNDCNGKDMMIDLRNCIKQGLHVDVSSNRSKGAFGGRIIRVYPFALALPMGATLLSSKVEIEKSADDVSMETKEPCSSLWSNLEMKGTEHDQMTFMDITDFLDMAEPCVPSLKMAFHHATCGSYLEVCALVHLAYTLAYPTTNGRACQDAAKCQ